MPRVRFDVEEAGCASCAARVRAALAPLVDVEEIVVDEKADAATVLVDGAIGEDEVAGALASASAGSGHSYRLKAGSWRVEG